MTATRYAQTAVISDPFSSPHQLHRLKRITFRLRAIVARGSAALSAQALPLMRVKKWNKKASLSERSEFRSFPIFWLAAKGTPQGQ